MLQLSANQGITEGNAGEPLLFTPSRSGLIEVQVVRAGVHVIRGGFNAQAR
jgi:hypothetical protein